MVPVDPTHDPGAVTAAGTTFDVASSETLLGVTTDAPRAGLVVPTAPPRSTAGVPTLDVGARVGRFVITGRLGAGGMGVVYAAYDPELERRVALKLMQDEARGGATRQSDGRTRLLREAQALARLSHPEVVAVHDVGEYQGSIWLAMEYVDGETLTEWRRRPRTWREVLDVMSAVGRGVAAAHDAGLVHRDLKPDNVMMGRDGRVRVMDFGLTRAHDSARARHDAPLGLSAGLAGLEVGDGHEALTRVGTLLGTPAYMSPEQFGGLEVGPASDQWSYCVTFWELLHGRRPFEGRTIAELATAVIEGRRAPAPTSSRAPRWLTRVIERGLSLEPSDRWPSMRALLDELRVATRRRWLGVGLSSLGVLAVALGGVAWSARAAAVAIEESCVVEGAALDGIWNESSREAIAASFAESGVNGAEAIASRLEPWLDDWAQTWREGRTEACLAHRRDGRLDASTYDAATWCYEARSLEFAALLDDFGHAEPTIVRDSISAAAALQPVSTCSDPTLLALQAEPPPLDTRDDVRALWRALGAVRSISARGRYEDALRALAEIEDGSLAAAWPARDAILALTRAGLEASLGRHDASERSATRAYFVAAGANEFGLAADAANHLVFGVGYDLGRVQEAENWARHAELAIARGGDALSLREAERVSSLASTYVVAGDYERGFENATRAAELRERALGPMHPTVAISLNNVGNSLETLGRYDEALPLYERALAIRVEVYGPDHPHVAASLYNLANVLEELGQRARAREAFERSLDVSRRALGPDHVDVAETMNAFANLLASGDAEEVEQARTLYRGAIDVLERALGPNAADLSRPLSNLAGIETDAGRHEEALRLVERALDLQQAAFGPEHPELAATFSTRARIHHARGDSAVALADYERTLEIRQSALGGEHPLTAAAMDNVAMMLVELGRHAEALEIARRSLAISEASLGPDHPDLYYALDHIALAALDAAPDEALAAARRSVELLERSEVTEDLRGAAKFTLAKAILAAEGDRDLAVETATSARSLLATDASDPDATREVDEWLAAETRKARTDRTGDVPR